MILVDTCVWIDFFNHPQSVYAQGLKNLIENDEDICLTDLGLTEILQGIKDDKIFHQVKEYLARFPILKASNLESYVQAANISRLCRRKGKAITKTIDMVISVIAIENGCTLFSKDKDFEIIASCSELRLWTLPKI